MTRAAALCGFLWGLLCSPRALQAQPADLAACLGGGFLCTEEVLARRYMGCSKTFYAYSGRVSWGPLQCVGPITVEVEARNLPTTRYPLYVEIVPIETPPCPPLSPGFVIASTLGGGSCPAWQTSGPIDITRLIPIGSLYALQLVFFESITGDFFSPAADCVRVTAHREVQPLEEQSWGNIKRLYR